MQYDFGFRFNVGNEVGAGHFFRCLSIAEKLIENGWVLGGEGSGHVICLDKHTTGDGIVSALQVLAVLRESQKSLAQCLSSVELYPQLLHNIRLTDKLNERQMMRVQALGKATEERLGSRYRVLIRASGTEPLLRVMVEGECKDAVADAVKGLSDAIGLIIKEA